MINSTRIFSVLLLSLLITSAALGQKLPNVQEAGLPLPAGVKIDGKATEWGDRYQAYNKATDVYYTLTNDNDNLYLIVKADKPRIITKIIDVGITFIINKEGKKSSDNNQNISVTYPDIKMAPGQQILWYAGAKVRSSVAVPISLNDRDTVKYATTPVDSMIAVANNLFTVAAKTIMVKGISSIADPSISIYNEERIKVAARFNNAGAYIYELSIPLNVLGLSAATAQRFSYSIHLENRLTNPKSGMQTHYIYPNHIMTDADQDLDSTTDFWAYYALVKP